MLYKLFDIIQDRIKNPVVGSYTLALLEAGADKILQKVGEEAVEVILAAKGQGKQRLVEETADLCYHVLVLLASEGVELGEVEKELKRRHGGGGK
jgi:phosphoribosyl-ATP pyrophosphohydrolase